MADHNQSEEALRRSEAQLSNAMKTASLGFWELDVAEGMFTFTDSFYAMFHTTAKEMGGYRMSIADYANRFVHPDDAALVGAETRKALETDDPYFNRYVEHRMIYADGSIGHIAVRIFIVKDENGKTVKTYGFNQDITARRRAEEAFLRNERELRTLMENLPDVVTRYDPRKKITFVNKAATAVSDKPSEWHLGKTVFETGLPEDLAALMDANLQKVIETKQPVQTTYTIPTPIGTRYVDTVTIPEFDNRGILQSMLSIGHNITERIRTEQVLRNAQKLEALGVLAGGIAHDFNNLLGGIFGYIDLASGKTKEKNVTRYLEKALGTIDRARSLTQQLLTFAKGGEPIKNLEILSPYIQDTVQFALSGSKISCKFTIPEDLWVCEFDRNQIGQVIDNIIINAQQAMPVGGTIIVSAKNVIIEDKIHLVLAKGKYVKISIKDHGIGMPKEILPRIFDPFYTTKPKGHGLGLATCYSIINRHGGCIEVESEPGKGSTFHVYIPASPGVYSEKTEQIRNHRGTGTILIMDDEEVIRETTADMLENFGYSVICTNNGSEAIALFNKMEKSRRKLSAIIFDLTVPGSMGGKEAIKEIRKVNKVIPVFVASGYADDSVMANPVKYGFTASICKPFRETELAKLLIKYLTDES